MIAQCKVLYDAIDDLTAYRSGRNLAWGLLEVSFVQLDVL